MALLALPFIGSLAAMLLPTNARNTEAWVAGAIALAVLLIGLSFYPAVSRGDVIRTTIEWLPSHGLDFALRADGFAWVFTLLVSAIGLLVVLYARYYMSPRDP